MPPKAAREGSRDKPEMGIMALHRKCTTQFHLSRGAGFYPVKCLPYGMRSLFHRGATYFTGASFSVSSPPASLELAIAGRRKLRKRKENPIDPVNPVR